MTLSEIVEINRNSNTIKFCNSSIDTKTKITLMKNLIPGTPISNCISSNLNDEYIVIQVVTGDQEKLKVGLILLDKSNPIPFGEIRSDLFKTLNESTYTFESKKLLEYFSGFIGSSQLFYSVMTSSPILIICENEPLIRKIILSILKILPEGLKSFKSFHTCTDNPQLLHFQGIPSYYSNLSAGKLMNSTTIHINNRLICGTNTCKFTDYLANLLLKKSFDDLEKEIESILVLAKDIEIDNSLVHTLSSDNYEFLLKLNQTLKDPSRLNA